MTSQWRTDRFSGAPDFRPDVMQNPDDHQHDDTTQDPLLRLIHSVMCERQSRSLTQQHNVFEFAETARNFQKTFSKYVLNTALRDEYDYARDVILTEHNTVVSNTFRVDC